MYGRIFYLDLSLNIVEGNRYMRKLGAVFTVSEYYSERNNIVSAIPCNFSLHVKTTFTARNANQQDPEIICCLMFDIQMSANLKYGRNCSTVIDFRGKNG